MRERFWRTVVVLALAGCSSEDSLGTGRGEVSRADNPQHSCFVPDPPAELTPGAGGASGVSVPGLTGTWVGTVNLFEFLDQPSTVTLRFPTGTVDGRVVFGSGAPPPPAVDGDAPYPPGFDGGHGGSPQTLAAGFAYTMLDGHVDQGKIVFSVATSELWQDWCGLQTTYSWAPQAASCNCLPNWGGKMVDGSCYQEEPGSGILVPVACQKFFMCSSMQLGACSCTASGCRANWARNITFALTLEGEQLAGTATSLFGTRSVQFASTGD